MTRTIHDLTLPLHNGMPIYPAPWHEGFEMTQLARHETDGRETRRVVIGTHVGTHCDAPVHLVNGAASTTNAFDLAVLVGPATIVDVPVAAGAAVTADVLTDALGDRRPTRLLLRYGWASRWGTDEYFTDYPFLTEEAARLIVDRGVRLVGSDTPSPDDPANGRGHDPDSPVHKILLGAGIVLVEYLTHLEAIAGDEFELVVLPLRLEGADGAPARCIAIE